MTEPLVPTIAEAGRRIRDRSLSPIELTEAVISRVERHDPGYRAYVTPTFDFARAAAVRAEAELAAGRYRGPMHGIPIALKDIIETEGIPTGGGSRLLAGNVPRRSAELWTRLQEAGAILLGKTETHEFANGGPRRLDASPYNFAALNPWNVKRYTGGSSSGSASATAASLCLGSVGSDTGGSIRIPAANCGLYGFKPSMGRVSRSGVFPASPTLDQCGPMTWCVEDAAIMLDAMAGHDPRDPTTGSLSHETFAGRGIESLKGLHIGYLRQFADEAGPLDPAVSAAIERALEVLVQLGAEIVEIRLPALYDFTAVNTTIMLSEFLALHRQRLGECFLDYSSYTRERAALGAFISAADYVTAQQLRRDFIDRYLRAMEGMEAVIAPCTALPAPDAEHAASALQKFLVVRRPVLTAPFNLLGAPAASICCGFSQEGLPIGMQIASIPGGDGKVLRVSRAYEAATDWHKRRPALIEPHVLPRNSASAS